MSKDTPSSRSVEQARVMEDEMWSGLLRSECIDLIARALDAARAEAREAYDYLRRIFEICAPQCEPLPDLMGLCTQIDNLIAGYRNELAILAGVIADLPTENIGESEERTTDNV